MYLQIIMKWKAVVLVTSVGKRAFWECMLSGCIKKQQQYFQFIWGINYLTSFDNNIYGKFITDKN